MKEYPFEEIEQHDTEHDCWLTIHGKVYDVTKFIDDHPGGSKVLVDNAGNDATHAFTNLNQHSRAAMAMMEKYRIGNADMTTVPGSSSYIPPVCHAPPSPEPNYVRQRGFQNNARNIPRIKVWLLLLILLLATSTAFFWPILVILVLAYADGRYTIEN